MTDRQVIIHGTKAGKFEYKCERKTVGGYYETLNGSKQGFKDTRDARRGLLAACSFYSGSMLDIPVIKMRYHDYLVHRNTQVQRKRKALKK